MRIALSREQLTLLLAALCVIALVLLHVRTEMPPPPIAASAPAQEFSAGRAALVLEQLLAEHEPHPVGSRENQRIRDRILARLRALGIDTQTQEALGCSRRYPSCAWIENVLGVVPGAGGRVPIVAMAHYDSVPPAPGAGDDGAAVVTLLESARILISEGTHRNGVIFLFTDGEETGLLGAEAFFDQHPLARQVEAVINLEGSGSSGQSMLLRTGPHSGWLVDLYRQTASAPAALSSTNDIFKWLPNDTDFSVAMDHGIAGLDFAFAGERSHYHTPLDTTGELSRATLQHHGENLAPLLLELADARIDATGSNRAYYTLYQRLWITWPLPLTSLLAALLLLGTALLARITLKRGWYTLRELLHALLGAVTLITGVALANLAIYHVCATLAGTIPDWPAHPAPLQTAVAATTLGTMLAIVGWVRKYTSPAAGLTALLFAWSLPGFLCACQYPFLANTFVIPAMLCVVVYGAFAMYDKPTAGVRRIAALILLAISVPFSLGVIVQAEPTLGYRSWPIGFPFYGIFAVAAVPILLDYLQRHAALSLLSLCGGAVVAGVVLAMSLPLYSQERPQPINILHLEDHGRQAAWWVVASPDPLPADLVDAFALKRADEPALPWRKDPIGMRAPAPLSNAPAPQLVGTVTTPLEHGREVRARFESPRHAANALILIPHPAGLQRVSIDGHNLPLGAMSSSDRFSGKYYEVRAHAVPATGFELEITLGVTAPVEVYIADWTSTLPDNTLPLRAERDLLGVPVHQGDQALIFARTAI